MKDWKIRVGDHQRPRQKWKLGNGNGYRSLMGDTVRTECPLGERRILELKIQLPERRHPCTQACGHAPILRLNVQPWVRSLSTVPISIIMSKENKMQLKGGNKYMEKQKGGGAKKSSKLTKAFFRNASMQLAKGHSLLKIILVSSCPHTAKDSVYPHVYKTSTFYLQRPHLSY